MFFGLLLIGPPVDAQKIDARDRDFRNGKFSHPKTPFNREAGRLLMEAVRDRKPGLAIDLGMGEGRNAIYPAQRGWQTTGADLSDVAAAQAKKRAMQIGSSWKP